MTKKLPPGNFLRTTNYEFSVKEEPAASTTAFSPKIPAKSKESIPKKPTQVRVQSAKTLKKPLSSSKFSECSLDLNIKPNYPEPKSREAQRPMTVKQILCEYEQEITNFNMLPLKVDLNPHILTNIQQKSLSKTGKTLDLYNKNKARTIEEIRMREKYQGKADSAVKVWLDQLAEEQSKQSKKFDKSFEAFHKAQARLDGQLQMLMNKVHETKVRNQEAFRNLTDCAGEFIGNSDANFKNFTLNNKPVKVKGDQGVVTSVVQYGKKGEYGMKEQGKDEKGEVGGELISDDDMFMDQISSPEDFEVLSDSEI